MPAKTRILVADDDAGIRDLIRTYLDAANYEVFMARDGSEVAALIAKVHPHAIILDINMPKMDGFTVLQEINRSQAAPRIGVLVLTARHASEDVHRAIGLGAKDYLTKPFTKQQILTRVARLLHRSILVTHV